jgi:transposase
MRNTSSLTFCSTGSAGTLSVGQKKEFLEHLEKHTYAKSAEICEYVREKYGVVYAQAWRIF